MWAPETPAPQNWQCRNAGRWMCRRKASGRVQTKMVDRVDSRVFPYHSGLTYGLTYCGNKLFAMKSRPVLHHVVPHLSRAPLLIEKRYSLIAAHTAAGIRCLVVRDERVLSRRSLFPYLSSSSRCSPC